ncbi:hypothetical protein N322_09852, partial [Cariama cristata]
KPRLSPNTGAATDTRPVYFSTCHYTSKIFSILQSSCFTSLDFTCRRNQRVAVLSADQPSSSSLLCSAVLVETFLSLCKHKRALVVFSC